MNSPFRIAQNSHADSQPTRVITITKPNGGEAVVVNLSHDGKVKLDLSAIANEKITIVKVPSGEPGGAEKAIILFDNQSTITIDPFFFGGQFPLNLTVELNTQQQDLTPSDFAALFPVTDDQSILPAGGDGGPAAGAEFSNPSVDPLAPSNPLPLLGPEELPNWTRTPELANLVVDDTPTFDAGQIFLLDEDSLTNPPAARAGNNDNALGDDDGGQSFSGTLHYDFKHDGPAGVDPIMVNVGALNALNLTSGKQPITFVWDAATFTLTGVINQGQPNETTIIKLQIDPATATSAGNDHPFTLEITGPLDHPGHDDPSTAATETSFEDNIVLHLDFTLTDSNGTATPGTVDINIDDDSPVLTQQPVQALTVDEDDIATPWSLGTSPNTNLEGPGDQSVTQGGGGLVHPAIVTGSVAGLVAFGADGEGAFGFSADAVSYFKSLNLFSKQTANPENGISLDYSITQDAVNHTITLHAYEPDTVTPGVTGNPVFDFVLDTQTGDFTFKLYDELIHTPGNGENTDLRSGGPGYYDVGNDGFAESFLDAANAPAQGSIPYLDFGRIITATDGDGDTIGLDGHVQITVKDDVPETRISVNPFGVVQHDETAGTQGPSPADPADSDTSSVTVRNLFSNFETLHAGELGNDTDVAHTPSGGPAIGYAHSLLPVVINSTTNYGADFPAASAVFSLQVADGTYSGVKTTEGYNVYLYSVDGFIVGRVGGNGVPGSQGDAHVDGQVAFAITVEQGGNIDVAQYLSLQHPDTSNNDETISLDDSAIQAKLVVTDSDGDAVPATVDIGSHIRFDDDGPKLIGRGESYTADEDDIAVLLQSVGSHPNDGNSDGSFTGAPADNILGPAYFAGSLAGQVNFGADGPAANGGFSFKAETITTLEGYGLTSKGGDLSYTMVGDMLVAYVERVGANNYNPVLDRTVFTLELDSNGQFEFKLYDQLDHVYGNNGENTQLAGSNGPIDNLNFGSLILATDGDGDSIALDGRLTITITDDVPHIIDFHETGAGVIIDESGGSNDNNVTGFGLLLVAPQFSGVENVGHDSQMNGGNPVYAANVVGVVAGAALSGADESLTSLLTLQLNGPVAANGGVDSHLQTTDHKEIYLFVENGLIVGRIDGDNNGTIDGSAQNSPDVAAFAININQLGQLSIAQYLSLHHDNPNNPDDRQTLIDSLIQVKLTVTDFDGDQDSRTLDIGDTIHFDDDGPRVNSRATVSAEADEDGLNNVQSIGNADTGQFGETGPTPALAVVNGVAGALNVLVNFGADGPGTPAFFVKDAAPIDSGLLSQGGHVMIASDGGVVRGYVDAGANDGYQAGDRLVFTLTVGGDGSYTFTLVDQIDHPTRDGLSGDDTENLLASSIDLSRYISAQDGDNDPVDLASGSFKIQVRDDIPVVLARDAAETTVTETHTIDYTLHAGNIDVRGVGQGGHDLLVTGVDLNEGDNTVNTNSGKIGIGDGQSIDGYEVKGPNKSGPEILTMQFVNNLDLGTNTFDSHDAFPSVKFSVDVAEKGPGDSPAVIFISATFHNDGANTDSFVGLTFKVNDVAVPATAVFDNGVLVGYVLDGVPDNATIEAIGASNFNILQVGNYNNFEFESTAGGATTTLTDGNSFKVYGIETEITTTTVTTETFTISHDESAGLNNAADPNAADDVNAPANGTDAYNVLFAANAIGYAKSGESVLITDNDFTALFTGSVGADEKPGGGGTWSFAITDSAGHSFNGTDSGLTTLDGTHILLTTDATTGALIGKAGNAEVFKVYVDSDGYVWISQYQAIHNDLAGSTDTAFDDIATVTVDGGLHIKGTLTDFDHDSTSAVSEVALVVRFQDDGPLAVDDFDTVVGMTATGNVIDGTNEVTPGVDRVGTDGATVTDVSSNNEPGHNATVNAGVLTIIGQYGTLELHPNGDYTYTRNDGAALIADDVFSYTLTDGDGDTSTAELTISIHDTGPTPTTATVSGNVDEDSLSNSDVDGVPLRPGEVDGAALGWSAVSTGNLAPLFNPGDGTPLHFSVLGSNAAIDTLTNQNLTSGGAALSYAVSGDTLTAYVEAGGGSGYQSGTDTPVFTLQIADDGSYTFTLLNEIDHPGGGNNENTLAINLGGLVHVTDNDGDPADASGPLAFQITVLDDMPSIALTGGNLIVDGDFAGGPGDFPLHVNEWQPGSGADTDGIPGWTVTGSPVNTASFVELERVGDGYLGMHTSTHGAMIDMAASPGNIAIAQTVTGAAGQTYAIQFEAGAPFPTTAQLQVYWGGQLIGTIDPTGPMTSYNYVVTANGGPQTLEFREVGDVTSPTPGAADGGYHGTYLANVAMIPVGIVDEDGLPNGNHDLPTPSVGDAQVPDTDGDHNEATTTGALNITWGVDDTDGGVDGIAADSGFIQDGANAAALTGRSVTFTNDSVGVSGGIPLTSHGEAVTFVLSQNNTVLTGMAGGREVFSVSLSDDGSGAYRFILKDSLDHAPNGDENDITLTFNFTATDFDGDAVNSHFAVGIDDDVPVLTVSAGDHPQTIALALDETVEPNYTSNASYDRYNGAETESAPGVSNGGADDVTAGAGPVYNHTPVILLNPVASQAIGSLTTAAGAIGSQFGVHVSFGADGPAAGGGLSQHLGFDLSGGSAATNLIATNTGAAQLAGFVSDASRAISLVQVSDSVIEGRIVGDPNNANDDYVAFRLTLNNASDPANASITIDQFMAIQQDDHTKFDENTILKLAQGSLDLKLDVVATDGDQDSTPVKSFTVNLANSDGSIVSFDDDGPVVKGVVQNNVGAELIQNGSFELGHDDIGTSDWSIYSVLLPGWSAGPDNIPFEVQTGGIGGMLAQDGNSLIELDGDTEGNPAHTPQGTPNPNHTDATIQQTVTTEAGETYQLSFWYAPRGGDGVNSSGLKVFFGGNEVYNIDPAPNPPAVWQLITIQVTATSASSVLAFQGTGSENEFGAFLDNVSLKQIIPLDDEQTNALGIAGGPGDDGNGVVATGKIDFDAGTDGLKSIELHGPANLKAIYVDSNGIGHSEDVSFQWTANGAGGTLLGTMNTPDGVKNVLTVTVDGSGNYTLTMLAPLDHPGHDDLSTPATEISFEDNIDLGIGFTITDGDGDQAAGTLHFNVDDDSPNAVAGNFTVGEVYEDGLKTPGNLSNGNAEPPALQPVSVLVTSAALANFVAAGADGLKSFGLNANATGTVHTSTGADLKSDGVTVTYAVDNGTGDVLGMAGNREVFRVHDNGDGTFTFTLNDQIDHLPNVPADNDSQTLDINIISAFTATDGDGDTVLLNLGSLNITVEDDIPFFAGDPYTLSVTQTGTVFSGNVDFHVGADDPGQFSITPPSINGVTTQTSTDPQTGIVTITGTFTDGGNPYYVFTFNPATGGYTFDLASLPTSTTPLDPVSLKQSPGFGPLPEKDYDGFKLLSDQGLNGSAQGVGVGSNRIEDGDHLTVQFDNPLASANLDIGFNGGGTLTLTWKAIDSATGQYETGSGMFSSDGTLTIDILGHNQAATSDPLATNITHFDKVVIEASGPSNAHGIITSISGVEVTQDQTPGPFVFNVTGSDYDGDKDSTTITVNTDLVPAISEPHGGDANTNILYQQIMIPLAALLAHDGVTPDTGITVTNVVGATVSGDYVVLPGAAPGSDTTFSYAFTDGTTTTASASMTIHRVDQFLDGTSGKDFFIARDWGETVNAGGDNDLIIKAGAALNGGDGNDYLFGTGGNNVISGNGGDDYIVGYGGTNTLDGGAGNDFLAGHGGTNILTGGAGNDVLYAQSTGGHNSSLDGGADNDTLYAGHYNGTTTLKGGSGNDTFEFLDYTIAPNPNAGAASTITDYAFGQDTVDLTGLLDHIYGPGNATTGDVRVTADPNNSSNAVVQIDVDTGAGQTWQSVVSLTGYNHAGNQVSVVLDHMTNQQHNYPVV